MTIQRTWHLSQAEAQLPIFHCKEISVTGQGDPYIKAWNLAHLVAPPAEEKVGHGVFWLESKSFVHVLLRGKCEYKHQTPALIREEGQVTEAAGTLQGARMSREHGQHKGKKRSLSSP